MASMHLSCDFVNPISDYEMDLDFREYCERHSHIIIKLGHGIIRATIYTNECIRLKYVYHLMGVWDVGIHQELVRSHCYVCW